MQEFRETDDNIDVSSRPLLRRHDGFSLPYVIAGLAATGLLSVAFSAAMVTQTKFQGTAVLRTGATAVHQNVTAAIASPLGWKYTRDGNDLKTRCLANVRPEACKSTPNESASKRLTISLYDASNREIVSADPSAGFTATGEPCTGYQPAPNGNDRCPIRVRAEWRANCTTSNCTATNFNPAEFVTVSFEYSPSPDNKAQRINVGALGMVEQNRMAALTSKASSVYCGSRGRIYIGRDNAFNGIDADNDGCVAYDAFRGPQGDKGPVGRTGSQGEPGLRGPRGDRGPDAECP